MWSSVWAPLAGLGSLLITASQVAVSQAFVPSTAGAARAAASAAAAEPQQQRQRNFHTPRRASTDLAATRRDVLRMPSSEPMVRVESNYIGLISAKV